MIKKFLITRPKHDLITNYLHDFSKQIVKITKEIRDIHVTNLEGDKVIRKNIENCLIKENPKLIFLNGHGDKFRVAGHNDEIILDKTNIKLTKDKIVYALSCNSLEELGDIAILEDAAAYIGYKARFMLVRDPLRSSNPSKDKNALPFKRACSTLINSLVFGMTVKKSIERTKEEYLHSIKSYGTSEDDPYGDVPLIRFALAWNLEFLDVCGNPEVVF